MQYIPRIIDETISLYLDIFGAVTIRGPKWCGKTTSAEKHARSIIKLQDPDFSAVYQQTAAVKPSLLLKGENPRLIDEWQDIPELWDAVRVDTDNRKGETGLYLLTGSSVITKKQKERIKHTGTGRIARLEMLPMSLYESGDSNGRISISGIFDNPSMDIDGIASDSSLEDLIAATCRGGWPESIGKSSAAAGIIARQYVKSLCESDVSRYLDEELDASILHAMLRSYARNICTLATKQSMMADVGITEPTFDRYEKALENLYIVANIPAWCPQIRSKSAMRAKKKRNLIDPSIAIAAMGVKPEYFYTDLKSFGFLFESLAIRDLKAYTSASGGSVSYYRDSYGLEADTVLHLDDGRYAIIEFKLGAKGIEEGKAHLRKLKELIAKYNEGNSQTPLRLPDLMIVITAEGIAYRDDDVLIIPLATLRP